MLELIQDLGTLYPTSNSKHKARYGLYKCFCGNEFKTQIQSIKSGATSSCGCYRKKKIHERSKTHGLRKHRIYFVWNDMIQRCNNKNSKPYKDYGARGITVCERWLNIKNFIEDMYPTYEEGLSIDRKNNDGNYEPNNCRWIANHEQQYNKREITKANTSGIKNISFCKRTKKWRVSIVRYNLKINKFFKLLEDAIKCKEDFLRDNT